MYRLKLLSDDSICVKYVSKKFNNGDWNYWCVVELIDFEEATGEKLNNVSKYIVEIFAVAPGACEVRWNSAIDSCGCEDITYTEFELVQVLSDYGISALLYRKSGNNKNELLKEARKELITINMMFGFYMDRQINRIGNNGWDFISGDIGFKS